MNFRAVHCDRIAAIDHGTGANALFNGCNKRKNFEGGTHLAAVCALTSYQVNLRLAVVATTVNGFNVAVTRLNNTACNLKTRRSCFLVRRVIKVLLCF